MFRRRMKALHWLAELHFGSNCVFLSQFSRVLQRPPSTSGSSSESTVKPAVFIVLVSGEDPRLALSLFWLAGRRPLRPGSIITN